MSSNDRIAQLDVAQLRTPADDSKGCRLALRFEAVDVNIPDVVWDGVRRRYWRFPVYLAPWVERVPEGGVAMQPLFPLIERHLRE